jgi:hypothetical protein
MKKWKQAGTLDKKDCALAEQKVARNGGIGKDETVPGHV